MQKISLTVSVSSEIPVTPEKLAKVIQTLIDIGISDASSTLEEKEGDLDAAEFASQLEVTVTSQAPRTLVNVKCGFVQAASDPGVDVEIFYWDNYNGGEDRKVSPHFESLAKNLDIPVRNN